MLGLSKEKRYLGDGVYMVYDGYSLHLTTEDGISATNTIVLEPEVWQSFDRYTKEIKEQGNDLIPAV